jgi:hypothetical protein
MYEVVVSCEQWKVMFDAELCNECVNRADLHAVTPACIAEHRSLDMRVAAWI